VRDVGLRAAVKNAFTNKYFLVYLSLFLVEFAGLFYTHHFFTGWKYVESKATLVAIPFIFCAGPFADRAGFRQLQLGYCLLLTVVCAYCLGMASWEFYWQRDADVFFYHRLTAEISVNAVFFSAYVIMAIAFLLFSLFSPADPIGAGPARCRTNAVSFNWLRIAMIFFFTVIMLLLSSRLMLLLLVVVFFRWLGEQRRRGMAVRRVTSISFLVALGVGLFTFTDNPFSRRCFELRPASLLDNLKSDQAAHSGFNGISLRLLMWKDALEVLKERNAWAFGVSAGDTQGLLNEKYLAAGMSQGYLGYNYHNQYIEVLVRSGFVGGSIFLLAIAMLIGLARLVASPEAVISLAVLLFLFVTESVLEMQHGLFLFAFFPLLTAKGVATQNTGIMQTCFR
jgi:O-antigen ligase